MRSIRNNPEMARQKINLKGKSGQPTKAGIVFEEGDTVTGKIAGLKVYAQPKKTSKVVATLVRGEEVKRSFIPAMTRAHLFPSKARMAKAGWKR